MICTRLHPAGRRAHAALRAFLAAATVGCADSPAPEVPPDQGATDTGAGPPPPLPAAPADTLAGGAAGPDTPSPSGWTAGDTRVSNTVTGVATLVAVRTAAHPEFDRIVFEFGGTEVPSYRLEYVDRPVRQCGSGDVVPLAGDAWLSIVFEPAQAHTEQGEATVTERSRSPRLPNLLELKLICDFEAQVEWIGAVRSPEPYRVGALTAPTRVVVDIRH